MLQKTAPDESALQSIRTMRVLVSKAARISQHFSPAHQDFLLILKHARKTPRHVRSSAFGDTKTQNPAEFQECAPRESPVLIAEPIAYQNIFPISC